MSCYFFEVSFASWVLELSDVASESEDSDVIEVTAEENDKTGPNGVERLREGDVAQIQNWQNSYMSWKDYA